MDAYSKHNINTVLDIPIYTSKESEYSKGIMEGVK